MTGDSVASARVSQAVVEHLSRTPVASGGSEVTDPDTVRVSQAVAETLHALSNPAVRVSQAVVEYLYLDGPINLAMEPLVLTLSLGTNEVTVEPPDFTAIPDGQLAG